MQAEASNATNYRSTIVATLKQSAATTGADFAYLLGTAIRESSLNPSAKATTSSAAGLFQFVEQTWLGAIKNYGAKHGLGSFANSIARGTDGHFHIANAGDRSAILALRTDPRVASLMEGEMAQEMRSRLEASLGRKVCGGELYAGHFLGAETACRLIKLATRQPSASAVEAFPAAAAANHEVFYRHDGTPKTVREIYDWSLSQPAARPRETVSATSQGDTARFVRDTPSVSAAIEAEPLLASITLWRPADDDAGSRTPFLISPGMMDLLTAFEPIAEHRDAA